MAGLYKLFYSIFLIKTFVQLATIAPKTIETLKIKGLERLSTMNKNTKITAICPISGNDCAKNRCPLWMHFKTKVYENDDIRTYNEYEQCSLIPITKSLLRRGFTGEHIDDENEENNRFVDNLKEVVKPKVEVPF